MSSPLASPEINIRSPRYYIARTVSTCWHCGSPTALVAIAVPPGHETLDVDDDASAWSVADHNAFLFYVDSLPAAVQKRISQYQPAYRPLAASAGSGSYRANHCEKCGCQLDEHELFCEPGGAFLPTSASAAAAIRLVLVEEPFETSAAGYSYEPPLFDAMIRG